ncbi:MAG: putative triple gene block protein 2 [Xinjiang alphaflexivirus 2]|nr:MAG: putative triple gene block protein 2 [Xinjiang alphaflexivirus 2]
MPLTPPPDPNKSYQLAILAAGVVLTTLVLVSDHTPKVGDQLHNLPFGGYYQDGTKKIHYWKNQHPNQLSQTLTKPNNFTVLIIALTIILLLHGLHKYNNNNSVRHSISCLHCKQNH